MSHRTPDNNTPEGSGGLRARHRLWSESGHSNTVWLDVGLMQGGIPALEFSIDDQTCCFPLRMNDLRMLAAGRIVILTSSAAECEISPSGPTLIIDFHRYGIHGQGRNFALPVEGLRDGLRRLIDPPRESRVVDDGRNEIRVALTDLAWGSVIESGAEISLEGNMIIVRFGADS